jgi:hypothetical protein
MVSSRTSNCSEWPAARVHAKLHKEQRGKETQDDCMRWRSQVNGELWMNSDKLRFCALITLRLCVKKQLRYHAKLHKEQRGKELLTTYNL